MCWHYAECTSCGYEVPCSAYCGCDDDDECQSRGHRDCKELDKCTKCYADLCSDCYSESKVCKKCVKKGERVYILVHCDKKVTQIGAFATDYDAMQFAEDEDVEDFYGGSLSGGTFVIHEIPIIKTLQDMKNLKKDLPMKR